MCSLTKDQNSVAVAARPVAQWLVLVGCLLLALAIYLPTALHASFLNFDDNLFFGPDNLVFARAMEQAKAGGFWSGLGYVIDPNHRIADVYLPVAHGSLFLDYWLFMGSALMPHVESALLHGLAAFVLVRLLLACRVAPAISCGAAAIFLAHPALCESVAWVSGRKDITSGLFVLLALLQIARLCERFLWWRVALAMLCAGLAMYCKATAVVQPLLAALICRYLGGDRRRYYGVGALLLVAVPIAWHHQAVAMSIGTMVAGDPFVRLLQIPGVLLHYLSTMFWPAGLNVLYPEVQTLESFRAALLPGLITLVLFTSCLVYCWRKTALRVVGFGLAGFVLALLPFNTAYPASVLAAADRYLYLAVPFAAVALLYPLALLTRRPVLVSVVAAVVTAVLGLFRAPCFANSEVLWRSSLAQDDDNAVAWLNRANARLSRAGIDVKALPEVGNWFGKAAQAARYPEHEQKARLGQLQVAMFAADYEAAAGFAQQAIAAAERIAQSGRAKPEAANAVLVKTLLYAITPLRACGQTAQANTALLRAQELLPDAASVVAVSVLLAADELAAQLRRKEPPQLLAADDPRALSLRARLDEVIASLQQEPRELVLRDLQILQLASGKLERLRGNRLPALRSFRLAIDAVQEQHTADPEAAESFLGAAEVCLDAGLYAEAEEYARKGVAWFVGFGLFADARLRHALARSFAGQGRLDDAILHLTPYVEQKPLDRDAARLLSSLLMSKAVVRMSDPKVTTAELSELMQRTLQINPQEPRVDIVRARLLRAQGKYSEAVLALDRARVHLPDFEDLKLMLLDNLRDLGYQCMLGKDDDGAVAAWRRFVVLADKDATTDAVTMQLSAIWRRAEQLGIDAEQRGELVEAERQYRRCLQIDPELHWGAWHLAQLLYQQDSTDLFMLDSCSQNALSFALHNQIERSRQVLLRAMVLRRLGREAEGCLVVDRYLAAPDATAAPAVLLLLRGFTPTRK
jgi:tetratricopeptide (TPR) repeat protein